MLNYKLQRTKHRSLRNPTVRQASDNLYDLMFTASSVPPISTNQHLKEQSVKIKGINSKEMGINCNISVVKQVKHSCGPLNIVSI